MVLYCRAFLEFKLVFYCFHHSYFFVGHVLKLPLLTELVRTKKAGIKACLDLSCIR